MLTHECKNRNAALITNSLNSKEKVGQIMKLYTAVTKAYSKEYSKNYEIDYNKMIKRPIDYSIFDSLRDTLSTVI